MTKLTTILVCLLLISCASTKPILRTVDDAASVLCQLAASKQQTEQLEGLSPREWCAVKKNLQPFIDAALAAQQEGAQKSGLQRAPDSE